MREDEIEDLASFANVSSEQKTVLATTGIVAEKCLYLLPARKSDQVIGCAGGWPEMPEGMQWPRDEKGFYPFLLWLDLDEAALQLPGFGAKGRLLLFEEPLGSAPVSLHTVDGGVELKERRLTESDEWVDMDLCRLPDGKAYSVERLKFRKGISVCFNDDLPEDDWDTLISLHPDSAVGQLGGFVGPNDRTERVEAYMGRQGHGQLNEFLGYAHKDPDKLPEPIEHQPEPQPEIDLNAIIDRNVNIGTFFKENLPRWQKRANEKRKSWPRTATIAVAKLTDAIAELEPLARNDFRAVAELSSKVAKYLERLSLMDDRSNRFVLDWIKSTPGYDGWLNQPKLIRGPVYERLCKIFDELIVVGQHPKADGFKRLLQESVNLLGEHGSVLGWHNWNFFVNNALRNLHNANAGFHRRQRERPDAEQMERIRNALVWKQSLTPGTIEAESRKVKLALALGEASDWCWGDCASRLYYVMQSGLEDGDLSCVVSALDAC